jgi:multicomponent Na+:H+ antiporter subunit G
MIYIDAITLVLLLMGIFFFVVGTIGLLRLPDVYTRMHATTKSDTLGAISLLMGLALYSGDFFTWAKMLIIIVFMFWANGKSYLRSCNCPVGLFEWRKTFWRDD